MLGQASNPMLEQAEQGIIDKVPANLKDALNRVIHAGLTIMYSPKLAQQRNERIANSTDPAQEAADGSARLMLNLYEQSGKKLPTEIIAPGAMVFAFEYLDLLAKAGKAQISPDLIAQATQATGESALKLMGIGKDQIAQLSAQAQQRSAKPAGIIAAAQGGA
jgi:hypothetical protein